MPYAYKQKIALWDWYDADNVSSTNDEIKNLISPNGLTVLSAESQSGGRGRRGRKWHCVSGNLYFTYTFNIPISELSRFVCLIGLSLAKTVLKLSPAAEIKIKWPNDVFLKNGKLSGILLENIEADLWAVGIGVNILAAPEIKGAAYSASSLLENGIRTDRETFLKLYLETFAADSMRYQKEGFTPLKEEWLKLAKNLGDTVVIKNEKTEKKGLFLTLDDNGYMVLKTNTGEERIIAGDLFVQN